MNLQEQARKQARDLARADRVFINSVREVLGLDPLYNQPPKQATHIHYYAPNQDSLDLGCKWNRARIRGSN